MTREVDETPEGRSSPTWPLATSPAEVGKLAGDIAVFRGQRRHYPQLIPSGLRGAERADQALGPAINAAFREAYGVEASAAATQAFATQQADELGEYLELIEDLDPFAPRPPPPVAAWFAGFDIEAYDRDIFELKAPPDPTARLQHYGVPTTALDVSYDPATAWFFATHERQPAGDRTWSYRRAAEPGVLYALQASDGTRLLDLRTETRWYPVGGLRGLRQAGGLLVGATDASRSYDHCVLATWTVACEDCDGIPSFHHLFPSPSDDQLYAALLAGGDDSSPARQTLARYVDRYLYEH